MTKEFIKKVGSYIFHFFSYEEYSKKIDKIFENSIKDEISKKKKKKKKKKKEI